MAGTGAPPNNQYAKKEVAGRTIGLYLKPAEQEIIKALLIKQGKSASRLEIDRYARKLFSESVSNLWNLAQTP